MLREGPLDEGTWLCEGPKDEGNFVARVFDDFRNRIKKRNKMGVLESLIDWTFEKYD